MRKLLFLIFCLLLICNCVKRQSAGTIQEKFHIPHIIQSFTKDSASYFEADSIVASDPFVQGKFKFSDSIRLEKSLFLKDRFEQNFDSLGDNYSTDGLQIFTDYRTDINYNLSSANKNYFPVFIVNETFSNKIIFGVSNYISAIQEALDSNGVWYPIESGSFGYGCGNTTYWGVNIKPQEFLVFLMPKYKGNYKTKLRVRFANSGTLLSKPYDGYINYSQFSVKKNKDLYDWIKVSPMRTLSLFYGARYPKELDFGPLY